MRVASRRAQSEQRRTGCGRLAISFLIQTPCAHFCTRTSGRVPEIAAIRPLRSQRLPSAIMIQTGTAILETLSCRFGAEYCSGCCSQPVFRGEVAFSVPVSACLSLNTVGAVLLSAIVRGNGETCPCFWCFGSEYCLSRREQSVFRGEVAFWTLFHQFGSDSLRRGVSDTAPWV